MTAWYKLKEYRRINGTELADTSDGRYRFPPTPTDHKAAKVAMAAKFGAEPAIVPNTPVMQRVILKAQRRPMISLPNPHPKAPTRRPTAC
jgi:hypothetical protein